MSDKNHFIPGIYNYCDRWCKRCTFTSRCRNYESTGNLQQEQLDLNNTAFWENLSKTFSKTVELLQKAATEHGVDLNNILSKEEKQELREKEALTEKNIKQHPLSKLCKHYQKLTLPFIEKEFNEKLVQKVRDMVQHTHLGITSEETAVHTVARLGDCEEIIQWYVFFIDAKLQRALSGKMDGEEWDTENGYSKDSDGSAKVSIIAVEKSMAAWVRLSELLPSAEDLSLQALSLLSKIKNTAIQEFPDAMKFKRPGFDA
jgi:hypothetical protein